MICDKYLSQFCLEWEIFYTKNVGNIETHILYSTTFFPQFLTFMRMWKNILEQDRPHVTIWRTCIECCLPKATDTHLEYVIFTVFPRQKLVA